MMIALILAILGHAIIMGPDTLPTEKVICAGLCFGVASVWAFAP